MAIVRHNRQFTQALLEAAVGQSTINTTAVVDGTVYYASDSDGIYYGYKDGSDIKLRRSAVVPEWITIDGVKSTNSKNRQFTINAFGTCSVAAGTVAKTVSITSGTPSLTAGCRIVVKFNNANTANSPTLNVNNLGAKNIYFQGAQITNGNTKNFLTGTCEFVYDGTGWCLIGGGGSATVQLSPGYAIITTKETPSSGVEVQGGTNKITLYDGTNSKDVPITISIPNNVTQDDTNPIENGKFVIGKGSGVVQGTELSWTTDAPTSTSTDATIPTSGAVYDAIQDAIGELSGALVYKGTVDATHALPASHEVGDTYVVAAAGTYAGQACEVGDMIICKTKGTVASDADWTVVNGENQVEDKAAVITTVASNTASPSKTTIATVDGTNLTEAIKHHHPSGAAAGTAGTSSATSGISIAIPYLTTDIDGHVTAKGTHTHTVTVADDGGLTYGGDYDGLGIVHDDTLKIASPTNELGINVDVGTNGMTNPSADADAWKHPIVSESGGSSNDGPTLSAGSGVGVTSSYADIPAATAGSTAANSTDGYMTGAQAYKLNGIAAGAQVNVLENVRLEGDSADLAKTSKRVTIPDMDGATASAAGAHGLVPKPAAGDQDKFLSGAGTWVTPTGTYTLPTATTSVKGGIKVGSGLTMGGTNNEVLSVVPDTSTIEIVDNELSVVFDEAEHATTVTTANAWKTPVVKATAKEHDGVGVDTQKQAIPAATVSSDGYMTSAQATKLNAAATTVDGVSAASNIINAYGTCSIAAGTAAKTVTITSGNFQAVAGLRVAVKFTNANTANNPTLNVSGSTTGSTGAKNIFVNGTQITTGANKGMLKGVCIFIYDGTQWHLIGGGSEYTAGSGLSLTDHTFSVNSTTDVYELTQSNGAWKNPVVIDDVDYGPYLDNDVDGSILVRGYYSSIPASMITSGNTTTYQDGYMTAVQAQALTTAIQYLTWEGESQA